jgi:hypothetical protein
MMPARWARPTPVGDLDCEANRLLDAERSAVDQRRERLARDMFHRDEVDALVRVDFVDRDDVPMVERRARRRLADEAVLSFRIVNVLQGQ